jgi:hypothetical protein
MSVLVRVDINIYIQLSTVSSCLAGSYQYFRQVGARGGKWGQGEARGGNRRQGEAIGGNGRQGEASKTTGESNVFDINIYITMSNT